MRVPPEAYAVKQVSAVSSLDQQLLGQLGQPAGIDLGGGGVGALLYQEDLLNEERTAIQQSDRTQPTDLCRVQIGDLPHVRECQRHHLDSRSLKVDNLGVEGVLAEAHVPTSEVWLSTVERKGQRLT